MVESVKFYITCIMRHNLCHINLNKSFKNRSRGYNLPKRSINEKDWTYLDRFRTLFNGKDWFSTRFSTRNVILLFKRSSCSNLYVRILEFSTFLRHPTFLTHFNPSTDRPKHWRIRNSGWGSHVESPKVWRILYLFEMGRVEDGKEYPIMTK